MNLPRHKHHQNRWITIILRPPRSRWCLVHSPKRGMVSSLKWRLWFSQAEKKLSTSSSLPLLADQNPFTKTPRKLTWHMKTHENHSNQPKRRSHSYWKTHHFIGKLILGIWALWTNQPQETTHLQPPFRPTESHSSEDNQRPLMVGFEYHPSVVVDVARMDV